MFIPYPSGGTYLAIPGETLGGYRSNSRNGIPEVSLPVSFLKKKKEKSVSGPSPSAQMH